MIVGRYWLQTLGCPKNQVDSDKLEGYLEAQGYDRALDADAADLVVVNTCAFIEAARQESIETVLHLAETRRDGARLVVTGCMAERYGDELRDALPEVDLVAGFGRDLTIGPGPPVGAVPVTLGAARAASDAGTTHTFDLLELPRPSSRAPWAYVKVAEGCDRICGFCAIPSFRGKQRSRSPARGAGRGRRPPHPYVGQPVSTDYFHVLGINPLLGRDFVAEENTGNGAHVAILSYGIWQTQMGGDRKTVGRTITLDGEPFTVIGVMPPGLEASADPILPGETDVWTPLALVGQTAGSGQNIEVLGRLRPGLSLPQAQAQMRSITSAFRKAFPQELDPTTTLSIQPFQAMLSSDVRLILLVLFGAVGLVLLIACANVANLLLGRANARSREFAVRAALGASRTRLVRQVLTESVLVSIVAALLALLLARIGMQSLLALSPSDLPRANDIHLDAWAFTFTLAVSVITGILFGLVPAFRASFGEIYEKLGVGTIRMSSGLGRDAFAQRLWSAK